MLTCVFPSLNYGPLGRCAYMWGPNSGLRVHALTCLYFKSGTCITALTPSCLSLSLHPWLVSTVHSEEYCGMSSFWEVTERKS